MASQANILVNLFFVIFIVFSCICGLPSEVNDEESDYFNRHLLFIRQCSKANLTYGKRESGDMLVDVQNVYKMKRWWKTVEYHLLVNRTNQKPNNITKIEVINMNKLCKCFGNKVNLYDGGVHKKYAKMNFTSEKGCELRYQVKVTAK